MADQNPAFQRSGTPLSERTNAAEVARRLGVRLKAAVSRRWGGLLTPPVPGGLASPPRKSEAIAAALGCGGYGLSRRRFSLLVVGSPLAALLGCAGYRMGSRSLYPPDIETVFVPMIESNSYRRGLGEWLTEAVVKEIENVTPLKVVNTREADSALSCRIMSDTKQLAMESPTDEGRELQVNFQVSVQWVDRKGDLIKPEQSIPGPAALQNTIQDTANMFPEIGQSITSAQQTAIQRLAQQIVSMMEAPW